MQSGYKKIVVRRSVFYFLGSVLMLSCFSMGIAGSQPKQVEVDDDDDKPARVRGQKPLVQEVLFSETVYLQEKRETQITLASGFRGRQGIQGTRLQMEYGLSDRFQVGTSMPFLLGTGAGACSLSGAIPDWRDILTLFHRKLYSGYSLLDGEAAIRVY
jgi:hypothetical protein